jgi:hypothetical protein
MSYVADSTQGVAEKKESHIVVYAFLVMNHWLIFLDEGYIRDSTPYRPI